MRLSSGARQSSNDTSQSRSVAEPDGIRKRSNAKASSGVQAFFTIICTYNRNFEIYFSGGASATGAAGISPMSVNPMSGGPMSCSLVSLRGHPPKRLQAYAACRVPACQTFRVPGWLSASQLDSIDYRGNQPIIRTGSHRDSNGLRKSGKIFSLLCRIYMGRDNSINS